MLCVPWPISGAACCIVTLPRASRVASACARPPPCEPWRRLSARPRPRAMRPFARAAGRVGAGIDEEIDALGCQRAVGFDAEFRLVLHGVARVLPEALRRGGHEFHRAAYLAREE